MRSNFFMITVIFLASAIIVVGISTFASNNQGPDNSCKSSVLANGANNACVKLAQTQLNYVCANIEELKNDGIFEENTDRAVRGFQQAKDLSVNGVIDSGTWNKLFDTYEKRERGAYNCMY